MDTAFWNLSTDWETPAGRLLKAFAATLPPDRHFTITLFGSAPLQITVDNQLLSADIGLFSKPSHDYKQELRELACQSG
jgi:hypothetical protein